MALNLRFANREHAVGVGLDGNRGETRRHRVGGGERRRFFRRETDIAVLVIDFIETVGGDLPEVAELGVAVIGVRVRARQVLREWQIHFQRIDVERGAGRL